MNEVVGRSCRFEDFTHGKNPKKSGAKPLYYGNSAAVVGQNHSTTGVDSCVTFFFFL